MLIDYLHKEVDKLGVAEYPNNTMEQLTLHRLEQLCHDFVRFAQAKRVFKSVDQTSHLDPFQVLACIIEHLIRDVCPLIRFYKEVAQDPVTVLDLELKQ